MLPIDPVTSESAAIGLKEPAILLPSSPTKYTPPSEKINAIISEKATPNVWTIIQKWILALPTTNEIEKERQAVLQLELERTVDDLAKTPNLGKNGV